MKYLLKTEVNGSGNKVFSKMRQGKGYIYLAKDENGNIGQVDKHWILRNQSNIVNLGVSGDSIYPVDIENKQKKDIVEEAAEILKEYYQTLQSCYLGVKLDGNEIEVIEGNDAGNIYIEHSFGANAFDLEEVHNRLYSMAYEDNDIYEDFLVEKCNNVSRGSDIYDLIDLIKDADSYNEHMQKDYDRVDIIFKKWSLLLGQNRMVSSELASMVEEKYEIDEIIE